MPEVDHRGLSQAAHDLVDARDHEVRAEAERVRGQLLVEGQMSAPGLVHDQGHTVPVGHLAERRDVRHRSEVGGRDHGRPGGAGRSGECPVERLGRHAMGDVELGIELGGHEGGPQAGHDQRVDRARVGVALSDHLRAAVAEREQRHVVSLRRPVHQPPGAARAPGLGRQLLRGRERSGLLTLIDAVGERGDVERDGRGAERLDEPGIGARTSLVPGHVETPGPTLPEGLQCVQIGGVGLRSGGPAARRTRRRFGNWHARRV